MSCNHRTNIPSPSKVIMIFESKNGSFNKRIGIPLMVWGGINVIISGFYFFSPPELIKGILLQAFLWGLIDALVGLFAYLWKKEFDLKKIKKILLVNVYLDIIYVIIGVLLIILSNSTFLIGNGYGVAIQGAFLFIVDLIHHVHLKNVIKN